MFITATGAKVQEDSGSSQTEVGNPGVGQRNRTAGMLRGRQSGQAGGNRVRTGKDQKPGGREKRDWGKAGANTKMLVGLTNKKNWK